jgi:hypothetical protein
MHKSDFGLVHGSPGLGTPKTPLFGPFLGTLGVLGDTSLKGRGPFPPGPNGPTAPIDVRTAPARQKIEERYNNKYQDLSHIHYDPNLYLLGLLNSFFDVRVRFLHQKGWGEGKNRPKTGEPKDPGTLFSPFLVLLTLFGVKGPKLGKIGVFTP